ncbi:ATP synthase epsilon chain, chloroplastic [Folsomia candida]|uniref:ATP synthase epsilon chain, chloroplastic n=1 Tax=Folsomia candida TaxID=158441 RepID=A0A226D7V6_FOLCA|nr:ATP synthase epsilon chain, chloroplastic [Folsomia candida]
MLKLEISIFLLFFFILLISSLKLPTLITQPRVGCTWKYSILEGNENTPNRINLDELFSHSETPKLLETFMDTGLIQLHMSSSISRRWNQCKVHVVILKDYSSSPYFPLVSGGDNAKTLVYILPDGWPIPGRVINKDWLWLIDSIRDIFVVNVNYDINHIAMLRAFQHRPAEIVEYDSSQGVPLPSGNFNLANIWVLEPTEATKPNIYPSSILYPAELPNLTELPTLIAPRFIVLHQLQKYLNFTPIFVQDIQLAIEDHAERGGVKLSTIFTPKILAFGFGPRTKHNTLNPLITTFLKIREEALHILYCQNDPSPYTPSAFSEMLFRAFDSSTWICLLVTYFVCALTAKLISPRDAYPFFGMTCLFFRQELNHFKPLHLILSLVFIPVLFPYEADITARVISPDEPKIYNNFQQLINNSFHIFVNQVQIWSDTVLEYESVTYKIAKANLAQRNMMNFIVALRKLRKLVEAINKRIKERGEKFGPSEKDPEGSKHLTEDGKDKCSQNGDGFQIVDVALVKTKQNCLKYGISRTFYYRRAGLEKKCHLVKESIVTNEPSIWTFKRDRGGGFMRGKTNQMFEHGLTALWYESHERETLTRPNLINLAYLDLPIEVLKIRKVAFVFVTAGAFLLVSFVVWLVEKIRQCWITRKLCLARNYYRRCCGETQVFEFLP